MVRRFFWALTARLTRATVCTPQYPAQTGPRTGRSRLSVVCCGSPQRPSSFLIRLTSALATSTRPVIRRVTCEDLPSSRCRLPACAATILPPPVSRARLPMPVWLFIFGISRCFSVLGPVGWPPSGRPRPGGCWSLRRVGAVGLLPRGGAGRGRGRLGGPVRSDHHDHVTAVLLRRGFHKTQLRNLFGEPAQEPEPQLRTALLATAEHDRHLDLVTGLEEPQDVTLLGLVVVRVDLRPELHLLVDCLLLVAPGFPRLECALVLVLAEVHELAHRRARHGRNLDQVQIHVRRQLKSSLQWDDAHLLALWADQPDFARPDLLVDAWFDADVASSSPFPRGGRYRGLRYPAPQPLPPGRRSKRRPRLMPGPRSTGQGRGAWSTPLHRSLPARLTGPGYLVSGTGGSGTLRFDQRRRSWSRPVTVWSTGEVYHDWSADPLISPRCAARSVRRPRTASTAYSLSAACTAITATTSSSSRSSVAQGAPRLNRTARTTPHGRS